VTTPHSSWAAHYDDAYRHSFGPFYEDLTQATIEAIEDQVEPSARILDVGAGTGRLSVPLAARGHDVTAVDPAQEMLDVLARKGVEAGVEIRCLAQRLEDVQLEEPVDMALCLFTVLLYLLDDASLTRSLDALALSIREGGLLFIDVPTRAIFESRHFRNPRIDRRVTVTSVEEDLYRYEESGELRHGDRAERYSDSFLIRHWPRYYVVARLQERGFSPIRDLSYEFAGSGSSYLMLRKEAEAKPSAFGAATDVLEYLHHRYRADAAAVASQGWGRRAISIVSLVPDPIGSRQVEAFQRIEPKYHFLFCFFFAALLDQAVHSALRSEHAEFSKLVETPKIVGVLGTADTNLHPAVLMLAATLWVPADEREHATEQLRRLSAYAVRGYRRLLENDFPERTGRLADPLARRKALETVFDQISSGLALLFLPQKLGSYSGWEPDVPLYRGWMTMIAEIFSEERERLKADG